MNPSAKNTSIVVAALLLVEAITQAIYTALYISQADVPRQWLWGVEGLLFALLAAYAGVAMVEAKQQVLGWSAIAFSAVLNVVQVGVGLTMFGPFRAASQNLEAVAPAAGAVVAFSFFIYNVAKILLGLAAMVFGKSLLNESEGMGRLLGGTTLVTGLVALLANWAVILLGRGGFVPSPVAGASGVLATVLLAACLLSLARRAR